MPRELLNPVLKEDELSHLLLNVETPPGPRLRAEMPDLFLAGCHDTTRCYTPGDVIRSPRPTQNHHQLQKKTISTFGPRCVAHYLYPCLEGGPLPLAFPHAGPHPCPHPFLSSSKTQSWGSKTKIKTIVREFYSKIARSLTN